MQTTTHILENPFECTGCPASFKDQVGYIRSKVVRQEGNLLVHVRTEIDPVIGYLCKLGHKYGSIRPQRPAGCVKAMANMKAICTITIPEDIKNV